MAKETPTHTLKAGFKLRSKEREYEIVRILGSGSFGITYLAVSKVNIGNISTTVKFAIKEHFVSASCYRGDDGASVQTVPAAKADVVDSRADFLTEANRLKEMCRKSRCIVSVNETFEANGTAYYVMEYLDGGNPSKVSEDEAVSIVRQIADAVEKIHEEKVLHLDIKPDNIVLKTNDKGDTYPVLIDFGISKHFDSDGRPTSRMNAKGASPGYAPQEQYADMGDFSPKYDIYALGAVLFYLTTGKNPPDAFKVSPNQQELKHELEELSSDNVRKAIINAMKPSAAERTATVRQFCDDLLGIDFIPVLNAGVSGIEFDEKKAQKTIVIESNTSWTAHADANWCTVQKRECEVLISVIKNKGNVARRCKVVLNSAPYGISQTIAVTQKGVGTQVIRDYDISWWGKYRLRVYQAGGAALTLCCILGLVWAFRTAPEKESRRLTEAIQQKDVKTLKKFADKDSTRAYKDLIYLLIKESDWEQAKIYADKYALKDSINYLLPMIKIYMQQGNYSNAKVYVEQYLSIFPNDKFILALKKDIENRLQDNISGKETGSEQMEIAQNNKNDAIITSGSIVETSAAESNDQKFARATNNFNLMKALALDNYAKAFYPLAEMYYKRNDYSNAKHWAQKAVMAKVNRLEAQKLLNAIDAPTPSKDEMFAEAKTIADFKVLADKGYAKAYATLAELYFREKHDYNSADAYIRKAKAANVDVARAKDVARMLKSMGWYDNDEHGGYPFK